MGGGGAFGKGVGVYRGRRNREEGLEWGLGELTVRLYARHVTVSQDAHP